MKNTMHLLIAAAFLLVAALPAAGAGASFDAAADSMASTSASLDSAAAPAAPPEVILYYFHRTLRCESCLTMEAYIEESLETFFADALAEGRLLWKPTDIEEPENVHYEEDFSLEFNTAVLVRLEKDEPLSWAKLEKTWDLLEEKDAFTAYIREHVANALLMNRPKPE